MNRAKKRTTSGTAITNQTVISDNPRSLPRNPVGNRLSLACCRACLRLFPRPAAGGALAALVCVLPVRHGPRLRVRRDPRPYAIQVPAVANTHPGARSGSRRRTRKFDAESRLALTRRARRMNRCLGEAFPNAHCELDYRTPLDLLVAVILSAQCTDERVNQVTPELFRRYPTAAD